MIIGLDLSYKACGLAWGETEELIRTKVFSTPSSMQLVERQQAIIKEIGSIVQADALCIIEGYAYSMNSSSDAILKELGGIVRYFLWKRTGVYPIAVSPPTLKKFVTGKGNSPKNLMLKAVFQKWGRDFNDDNRADAYALTRLGFSLQSQKTSYEKDAVSKVTKGLDASQAARLVQIFAQKS